MESKNYIKAFGFSAGWFGMFILMQLVYTAFAFVFKAIIDSSYITTVIDLFQQAESQGTEASMNAYMEVIGGITSYLEVLLAVAASGFFIIDREIHGNRFAFNKIKIKDTPILISLGILLNIISSIFINTFSQEVLTDTGYNTDVLMQGSLFSMLIGIGICAPICEELIFRYFIYHNLNRGNQVLAIILSSVLFGLAHGNLLQGIYAFTFGIVFALINAKNKSILPGIILHITINSLSVLLMIFETGTAQIAAMGSAFVISLIPTAIVLFDKIRNHEEIL